MNSPKYKEAVRDVNPAYVAGHDERHVASVDGILLHARPLQAYLDVRHLSAEKQQEAGDFAKKLIEAGRIATGHYDHGHMVFDTIQDKSGFMVEARKEGRIPLKEFKI